jgi:hypothetical protein
VYQDSPLGQQRADALLVSLETLDEVLLEAPHAIGEKARAVEQVADHDGLEDVELKVALGTGEGGGDVVAENLGADHGKGLALGGVDLAGHNGGAGLVLGKLELAEATAGAGAKEADVLGNLEERGGEDIELTVGLDDGVVGGQSLKLVGCSDEVVAGHFADLGSDILGEALEGVDAGADGGAALGEHLEAGQRRLDALNAKVELGNVARELLAQSQGSGVLQMGATDLDELLPLVTLLLEGVAQAGEGGQQRLLEVEDGGNVHDGGEGVVGRGRHVDVVVGVDGLLGAHGAAENLNGAVGDDLVGVHVGLGARPRLPDDEGEVVDELEGSDLFGSLLDGLAELGVETELHVDRGGSALENAKGADNGRGHAVLGLVDLEVLEGALRLGAPVAVGGDLELAKGIRLGAGGFVAGHGGGGGAEGAVGGGGSGEGLGTQRCGRSGRARGKGGEGAQRGGVGGSHMCACQTRGPEQRRGGAEHGNWLGGKLGGAGRGCWLSADGNWAAAMPGDGWWQTTRAEKRH